MRNVEQMFIYILPIFIYLIVCKATILEMETEVKKVDPRKKVEVSGFRLDPNGKTKTKSIQYSKSETYLTELMESICKQNTLYSMLLPTVSITSRSKYLYLYR